MAKRPSVPFELHASLHLRRNIELAHGFEAVLSPDAATLGVISGEWPTHQVALHDLASGGVATALARETHCAAEHFTWSPDASTWAAGEVFFDQDVRFGRVWVGQTRGGEPRASITERYCAVTRNALARAASIFSFSPDGSRVVMRVAGGDDPGRLISVSTRDGAVSDWRFAAQEADLYAQAFEPDGALVTLSAEPGDHGGFAWYRPGARSPAGRLPGVVGCAMVPTRDGYWCLGVPQRCFRVSRGAKPGAFAAPRLVGERVDALRSRARTARDHEYLNGLRRRLDDAPQGLNDAVTASPPWRVRAMENELLWETSFADRLGDDELIVSDGVGVWRWRDEAAGLSRALLLDDPDRATHKGARIIGLSVADRTLALLWQRDARGAKTVVSLFEITD